MASSPSDILTPLQQEFLNHFFRQTSAFFLFLHLHGIDFKAYIDRARTKDAGMSKATLAYVLSQLSIDRLPPYMIKPLSLSELQQFFRRLAEELAAECFPEGSR